MTAMVARLDEAALALHLARSNSHGRRMKVLPTVIASLMMLSSLNENATAAELKLGIIGLDTSHVTAFTKILNDSKAPNHVQGGKVVAAFKSSSADIPSSANRVEQYTAQLQNE